MSSAWTKCEGKCPCGLSDFVDVRYPDGEESLALAAGGLPWHEIVEWRFSEPWSTIQNAYIEGFAHGYGGEETYARSVGAGNWHRSQAHDDAIVALRDFGKLEGRS
jgi:hypothetical protein